MSLDNKRFMYSVILEWLFDSQTKKDNFIHCGIHSPINLKYITVYRNNFYSLHWICIDPYMFIRECHQSSDYQIRQKSFFLNNIILFKSSIKRHNYHEKLIMIFLIFCTSHISSSSFYTHTQINWAKIITITTQSH